ncbi:MAG: histidine phosphatase family protein [Gemmobacter sp.]|nr:histidine phosphatase family protein [Gemmobacter sp.]
MTTLRLILTRHTKSAWDDPTLADHDRPLNARGLRSTALIGAWLASRGDVPGEVLCSDALRTRQTWEGIAPHLTGAPAVTLKPALYHAGPDVMLAVLRGATNPCVMMLGHNPGIAEFASRICARPPVDPDFNRFPTGSTLVVTFEQANWADVVFGAGAALDFVTPDALAS